MQAILFIELDNAVDMNYMVHMRQFPLMKLPNFRNTAIQQGLQVLVMLFVLPDDDRLPNFL